MRNFRIEHKSIINNGGTRYVSIPRDWISKNVPNEEEGVQLIIGDELIIIATKEQLRNLTAIPHIVEKMLGVEE